MQLTEVPGMKIEISEFSQSATPYGQTAESFVHKKVIKQGTKRSKSRTIYQDRLSQDAHTPNSRMGATMRNSPLRNKSNFRPVANSRLQNNKSFNDSNEGPNALYNCVDEANKFDGMLRILSTHGNFKPYWMCEKAL